MLKALEHNIDLSIFLHYKFDANQMSLILNCLIDGYLPEELLKYHFSNKQLLEIKIGLQEGLDISAFANPKYIASKMREIRLGLLHNVDVELYNRVSFSASQMHEIRLGLESNLDVRCYAKTGFTANHMKFVRENLQNK